MPAKAMVFRWLASNQEFRRSYALARECQAEDMMDEILKIADASSHDYMKKRHEKDRRRWQETWPWIGSTSPANA
jgi:hypothetical protein